ncbi:MAG: hypothetical protein CVU77_04810 [Elusimicrobia bacterium HGW-Elusimicrobia-1]|jgi:enterochelin esterase-like enzyme/pimeloyl-ACP methyl ester carboxylesterase|nr:MAG: hypothetical protein CVU77_04810 [Elusimicrobia bacterium HGW-Elusimicrobia-1]
MFPFEKKEIIVPPHSLYAEAYLPSAGQKESSGALPFVFVGGVFDGSWIFARHAEYMASRGRPVYALNLRGQYKSRWPYVSRLTLSDYLDDISSSIKHIIKGPYALAGYSMGAALALRFTESAFASGGANVAPPSSLILYDPTYPREAAEAAGEKPPKRLPRLAPAMHFIPPKSIVEEMLDETILHGAYLRAVELFRYTYASSQVYRQTEIERLQSDPSAVKCPSLILAVDGKNPAYSAFARMLNARLILFGGYSHGSFLTGRYFEPVARMVSEWMDETSAKTPPESEKIRSYNWHLDTSFEGGKHKMLLRYFTGWEKPSVEIYSASGQHAASVAMKNIGAGRKDKERIYEAEFNFKRNNSFAITEVTDEVSSVTPPGAATTALPRSIADIPSPGRRYAPLLSDLWLMDGKFYQTRPTEEPVAPKYFTKYFESSAMKQKIAAHIRLPRNYDPQKKYPLAVLNDGQNQYKGWGMHGGWHTDASLQYLCEAGRMPDTVLIAVESPRRRRNETYLPPPIGRADLYVNFLADELLPSLAKEISLTTDPRQTAIIGASYGANNSVYAGLFRPDVFGLVGSLSFAYLPKCPARTDMRARAQLPFARLYADCGTKWADDQPRRDDSTPSTKDLVNIAKEKGMTENENLLGLVFAGHYHSETFWRKRIGICLEFLLAPRI